MSSNETMSKAFSCKNCNRYRYACICKEFVSNNPEALKYLEEETDDIVDDAISSAIKSATNEHTNT